MGDAGRDGGQRRIASADKSALCGIMFPPRTSVVTTENRFKRTPRTRVIGIIARESSGIQIRCAFEAEHDNADSMARKRLNHSSILNSYSLEILNVIHFIPKSYSFRNSITLEIE